MIQKRGIRKDVSKYARNVQGLNLVRTISGSGKTPQYVKIDNFKPGDKLIFYTKPGIVVFAGHVFINGVTYPTNTGNFKITGTTA